MLTLRNVNKYYDRRLAIGIPLLELPPAIYWMQGPNGSGKTTLLRSIAGVLPFTGEIIFDEILQHRNPVEYRRLVSWADAEPLFPGFMTGTELVAFCEGIRRSDPAKSRALAEQFNMTSYISEKVSTYSSGMTKKLALLLSLIGETPLVILDEPLITLDDEAVKILSKLIHHRLETMGTTFLLSSHVDPQQDFFSGAKIITVRNQTAMLQ